MKCANTKKAIVGISLLLVFLLFGGSLLYAHLRPHGGFGCSEPKERAAWIQDRLTKELSLDQAQQQELETMVRDLLEKGQARHELRMTSKQELVSMLRKNSVDRQLIETLSAKHQGGIAEFIQTAGERLGDFLDILTPEQKQRLADVIEKHERSGHCRSE